MSDTDKSISANDELIDKRKKLIDNMKKYIKKVNNSPLRVYKLEGILE